MAAAKPSPHPVIRALLWILDPAHRTQANGRPWSMRALSEAAGLRSTSHVNGIVNGRQSPNLELDTAQRLARAGDVRVSWLLTGEGEPGHYGSAEIPAARPLPTPPLVPISLSRALDAAFDSKRHRASDAIAVRDLLASGLTLSRPLEASGLAGALLDAAADLREQGQPVSKDALLEALALRVVALSAPPASPPRRTGS